MIVLVGYAARGADIILQVYGSKGAADVYVPDVLDTPGDKAWQVAAKATAKKGRAKA